MGTLPKLVLAGVAVNAAAELDSGVWPAALFAVIPPSGINASATKIQALRLRTVFSFCWKFGQGP
jgi:hypothetical protein